MVILYEKSSTYCSSYQGWRLRCSVHSVNSSCFILASVHTYSHVLQFLYAKWQHFLSVPFSYLSLSSSPRLDPSLDCHVGTKTNLLAYNIKDISLVQRGVFHPLFITYVHNHTCISTCIYNVYTCTLFMCMYTVLVHTLLWCSTQVFTYSLSMRVYMLTTTVQGPLACLTPPWFFP